MKKVVQPDMSGKTCKRDGHKWEVVGVVPMTGESVMMCIVCGISKSRSKRNEII